jgi:hypothetical protein
MQLRFLPFYNAYSDFCYRISKGPYIAAVGLNREFFTYSSDSCTRQPTYLICSQESIRLHTNPRTCTELLLTSSEEILPQSCTNKMTIGKCENQEYISLDWCILRFLPYNDTITYNCPKFTSRFQIEKGLTKINISN